MEEDVKRQAKRRGKGRRPGRVNLVKSNRDTWDTIDNTKRQKSPNSNLVPGNLSFRGDTIRAEYLVLACGRLYQVHQVCREQLRNYSLQVCIVPGIVAGNSKTDTVPVNC